MLHFKRFKALLTFSTLLGALACTPAMAHDYQVGPIRIDHPWARATVPGQQAGGAFLKLQNSGSTPDKLISVSTDIAKSAELHSMALEANVMRMRQINALDIPAGQTIELKPGSLHIMLTGLNAPLKVGDSVPLKLKFEKAGEVTVQVKVEALGTQGASAAAPGQMPAGDAAMHQHQHP